MAVGGGGGVAVGGNCVAVGGTGVAVGGGWVAVGDGVAVDVRVAVAVAVAFAVAVEVAGALVGVFFAVAVAVAGARVGVAEEVAVAAAGERVLVFAAVAVAGMRVGDGVGSCAIPAGGGGVIVGDGEADGDAVGDAVGPSALVVEVAVGGLRSGVRGWASAVACASASPLLSTPSAVSSNETACGVELHPASKTAATRVTGSTALILIPTAEMYPIRLRIAATNDDDNRVNKAFRRWQPNSCTGMLRPTLPR